MHRVRRAVPGLLHAAVAPGPGALPGKVQVRAVPEAMPEQRKQGQDGPAHRGQTEPGRQFNRQNFALSFSSKTTLVSSLGLRFPTQ